MKGQSICPGGGDVSCQSLRRAIAWGNGLTGTFFCDKTTAQDFPLTPTEVMFAAVIALKAYSKCDRIVRITSLELGKRCRPGGGTARQSRRMES